MQRGRARLSWAREQRDWARSSLVAHGVDVVCPGCAARAAVRIARAETRLVCSACGIARRCSAVQGWPAAGDGIAVDRASGAALWFQASCAGHTLWAVNEEHLAYLERFVAAGLRRDRSHRLLNGVLCEQLPKWMVLARHRDEILESIERIRRRRPPDAGRRSSAVPV